MSAGFCLHCGLKLPDTIYKLHAECADAWAVDQTASVGAPKTRMEQQLDRIEGLLKDIRDNQPNILDTPL